MRLKAVMWKTALVALCALLVLPLKSAAADMPPYEIYAILGMTGPATFVSQGQQQALKAFEDMFNKQGGIKGRKIHITVLDDKTDPQVGVQLANDVVAKKAPVIIVSGLVAVCRAVAALMTNGPVEYCLSPALYPKKDSYVFAGSSSTHDQLVAMLRYFNARGWNRIGMLSSIDASGQDVDAQMDALLAQPENKNIQLIDREHFAPNDIAVAAQIAKIKAANPQVFVAWTSGTPFGTVLRTAHDTGLELPIATTNGNLVYQQMKQYTSFLPKDLYVSGPGFIVAQATTAKGRALQQQFVDALRKVGGTPDYVTGSAWDPALIIVDALRHLGTNATADQIRTYILGIKSMPGISGTYDFSTGDQRGLSDKDVVLMRWDESKDWWTAVSRPGGFPLK